MGRTRFLVNVEPPEIRIAELHDGKLFSLDVDRGGRLLGDIYKGQIENILPGMDAAFINIGLARNALIYAGDVETGDGIFDKPAVAPIESLLKARDHLIVQISRPPVGSKGARVTTKLSLPGRFVVLSTNSDTVGVSRRIEDDEERARLRRIADKLRPLDHGLIIRTEAENISESELSRDIEQIQNRLQTIRENAAPVVPPALLYRDLGLLGRLVRDRLHDDVEAIIIDSPEVCEEVIELANSLAPHLAERIKIHDDIRPIFHQYNVDVEIRRATERTVPLPHGGAIVIDETEALTAIDVNTGRFVGKNRLADTVLQTNLEAVEEAARQIRLRDLGGVIVIDFIDMERTRDRIKVLNALEAALKQDRTRTRIVQLSPSGLVEITRRREGNSLRQILNRPCPYCSGEGVIKTAATTGIQVRRAVREAAAREKSAGNIDFAIQVILHPETACAFLGDDAQFVQDLEESVGCMVFLKVDFNLHLEASRLSTGSTASFLPGTEAAASDKAMVEARFELAQNPALYPYKAPQYIVLQEKLVHLELDGPRPEGKTGEENVILSPRVIEIIEQGRWFHRARVIVNNPPKQSAGEKTS